MQSKWYESKPKALELRQKGTSLREVEKILHIPKSTLSGWFRSIKLSEKQKLRLKVNQLKHLQKARKQAIKWHNLQREIRLKNAEEEAEKVLSKLDHNNKVIQELALEENASRIAEEAAALLKAPQCPTGYKDIILDSSQLALQIHESCGHPAELDRVLGTEADFAGRSFLTPDKLHSFLYGSPVINIVADSLTPGGMGTYGFDDEGVPAQRWYLVKEGLFCGYLTSRQTAPEIGLNHSQGAMRACNWNRLPLIRMNNVSLEPGQWNLEDLIADTKDGVFMETNRSWSIDQLRYNFQFGTEIGWEIKNGKLEVLKDNLFKYDLAGILEEASNNEIKVKYDNDIIFYVESWGQLSCKEILNEALDIFNETFDEFNEKVKELK